jgi:hypothetical protein
VPGICNGIHTHTGAASGGGIAATTLTGTGSGGKFKYEFDTLGKLTLIEAMTHENLLLQSNTFSTTWTDPNADIDGGYAGYDGTNDAWELSLTGTFGQTAQAVSASGVYTFSFYAKSGTSDFTRPYIAGPNEYAYFDLLNGQTGLQTGVASSIEDAGNGWWRCSFTVEGTITEVRIHVADSINTIGTSTSGTIYIQDAQLESGTQATGYIETTTAPVTEGAGQGYRVDDKLSITTNEGHDIEFRLVEGSNATTVTVGMEATKPSKPVPFPVTKMRVADSTDRRVLIMDQRSRYVFPKPTPYLLDTYEGAAAAYSLRRLRSAYTGPAVRVRRESNNDELDIYFDGQGNLDTASLEAFCAGTNGFVKVWYDQGPGGNNAEQTVTADQPKIVSSGSIIEEGGKPALEFDVDSLVPSITNAASDYSFFSVTKSNVSLANAHTIDVQSGRLIFDGRGSSLGVYYDGAWRGTPHNSTVQQVNSIFAIAPTSGQSYINGSVVNTGLSYTQKPLGGTIRIGQNSVGSFNYWSGTMQEIVLYASDETSNRTGIETNINDYYSIY